MTKLNLQENLDNFQDMPNLTPLLKIYLLQLVAGTGN